MIVPFFTVRCVLTLCLLHLLCNCTLTLLPLLSMPLMLSVGVLGCLFFSGVIREQRQLMIFSDLLVTGCFKWIVSIACSFFTGAAFAQSAWLGVWH